jgi:hypothetical protein
MQIGQNAPVGRGFVITDYSSLKPACDHVFPEVGNCQIRSGAVSDGLQKWPPQPGGATAKVWRLLASSGIDGTAKADFCMHIPGRPPVRARQSLATAFFSL